MVIPFANTKLRLPRGFQSLVVGLSTEVLRNQPKNINEFAAQYFERLLQRRAQGQSYLPEKQTSLEDRYYNNQSFQEEYPVNDPDANNAATKIQAQFRGHKARRDLEKNKKNTQIVDTDQQELGYGREQSATSNEAEHQTSYHEDEKSSPLPSAHSQQEKDENEEVSFEEELSEEEKREQQRAAVAIQAKFRGYQVRKNLPKSFDTTNEHEQLSDQQKKQDFENIHEKTPSPLSTHSSEKMNSDLSGNSTTHGTTGAGENIDLEREGTQLSEDSERHTKLPRDPDFNREQQPESFEFENDMSDPNLDKAATRIQASFRGYKIRKELGTGSGPTNRTDDQQPSSNSPETHDEYDNARNKNILSPSAEGNKEPIVEENDTAAAVKIQAAYRGYRVRKDLEK